MNIQGQDKPRQYLVFNRKTGRYLGDKLKGAIKVWFEHPRHRIEGGSDRATTFTLDEAHGMCYAHPQLSYCPVNPQSCDWF